MFVALLAPLQELISALFNLAKLSRAGLFRLFFHFNQPITTMKKSLKLNDLKVKSFVTEVNAPNKIKGGASEICASQFPLCVNTTFTQVTCILC